MSNKKKVTLKKEDLGQLVVTFPMLGPMLRQPCVFPPGCVVEENEGMIRVKNGRNIVAYFNAGQWDSVYYLGALVEDDSEKGKELWA